MQDDRRGWLAGWALAAALGMATHYFVAFVVAPETVLLWRHRPRRIGFWPTATAAVVIVGLALIPLALAQRGTGHADYIAQGALGTRALQVPKQLLLGYASPLQIFTAVLAAAAVLVGAVWPLATDPDARARARVPLVVGLACVLVPMALAVVGIDFLDTRNLLPALPALYIAAAMGFASARSWPLGGGLAVALAVISLLVVVLVDATPRFQRDDRARNGRWGRRRGRARSSRPTPGWSRSRRICPGFGSSPAQRRCASSTSSTSRRRRPATARRFPPG
jgi:hypothetical protein